MQSIEEVAALRAQLWDSGWRPVPIYNPDVPGPSPGKRPWGEQWQVQARREPPAAVVEPPRSEALNTGILCDGLRAIDFDIDNPTLAHSCRAIAIGMFGEAPVRTRRDSPRCLIVYRAAEGMPRKTSIAGTFGKIEVLGFGQQFVAFGTHPAGADLEWFPEPPGQELLASIPAVAEADIEAFLAACAPIINARVKPKANGHDHTAGEAQADTLRVAAALARIPNDGAPDWDDWNRIGMAIWRATDGTTAGYEIFNAWSLRNPAYDPEQTRERWDHYAVSPPSQIGAGTIFHLAFNQPADAPPSTPPPDVDDAGYWASIERDAAMSADDWSQLEQRARGHAIPASPEAAARAGKQLLWALSEPWADSMISLRPWIARGYLMRRSVTVISGPSSTGKSSLMVGWAATLAVGCAFHRLKARRPLRVAVYNVEDDADEQKRRFSALLHRLDLTSHAFEGRMAILGPTWVGTLLHTARDGGLLVNTPVMDQLETFVDEFHPDVLILDPFVELHVVEENDNTAIRAVMARLRAWAVQHDMAVVVLHHARKGNGDPGDPDTLRGASSIIGAARVVLTINTMTEREAEMFGLSPEQRRNYFRLDSAKNNYAPIERAEWFERIEVRLENGRDGELGDGVAVAWPWQPPKLWAQFTSAEINQVLDTIDAGPAPGVRYAPDRRGKNNDRWAGEVLTDKLQVTVEQAVQMIATWVKNGLLEKADYWDPTQRRSRRAISVVASRRPT